MSETQNLAIVVDDDLILNLLYQTFLKKLGFATKGHIVDGGKAIEFARINDPDLILMDIALQGEIDGIQAIQEIRKFTLCPVIYITANSSFYYKSRAQQTDYHDFLVKPIGLNDLEASIHKLFLK